MRPDLVRRLAGLSVPRYTSYPAVADFSPAVGPRQAAAWLGALDPGRPVSVFLAAPKQAEAAPRTAAAAGYEAALRAEIALVAAGLQARLPVSRIAWGRGMPEILGARGLAAVLCELAGHFQLPPGLDHAIALDPDLLDPAFCTALAALGVNRASLRIEDIDPAPRAASGRERPLGTARAAASMLRRAGIRRLDLHIADGLPHQTGAGLVRACREALALVPDRLVLHADAPLPTARPDRGRIELDALPAAEERVRRAEAVDRTLRAHGYRAVGIDHYARPCDPLAVAARNGRLHRDVETYTDDDAPNLVGFGASAISRLPGGYAQNVPDLAAYGSSVAAGRLATARGHALSPEDRERGAIIERLICDFSVDLGPRAARYGDELALLRPFVADGLLETRGQTLRLTREGRPFVHLVCALFDQFRTDGGSRLAEAV
ncbi:hypothetical protein [Aurantimonas sp. Leaf443]|uniref:hypothetical protein n=1 Tax=Aurantimonas sp. Leaf443 TaxID=1736378 RepID=UPI0006F84A43|nr:hypothetical protein [Aurantimonas sp. Leaf443]KQT84050.1 hypothetical protein ASG48_11790 [Aurantimonas sp. Leaf443]